MKLKNDLDYVEFYAEQLKINNKFFREYKKIIDSQIKASSSLFGKMFEKENYRLKAREYLKNMLIIKSSS
ncbi:hypothetical protein HY212_02460 [Candidatus Pacearchaeota archaeon]|nr:hypothetical protein [Candidatus Pacearchaeota archaeon]